MPLEVSKRWVSTYYVSRGGRRGSEAKLNEKVGGWIGYINEDAFALVFS